MYTVVPGPENARSLHELCAHRPTLALCVQFDHGRGGVVRSPSQAASGSGSLLSFSVAANFSERLPLLGSMCALLMPCVHDALWPELPDIVALGLHEASCSPMRFRECGLDIFLYAPNPDGTSTAVSFGMTLVRSPMPWTIRPRVTDFAGHRYKVPLTVHDLTLWMQERGLRDMQTLVGSARPGPGHVGDVCQDMAALLRRDPAEYRKVALHQAELALMYADLVYNRSRPGRHGHP